PLGMLTLFSGDPKLGKSLATLGLIAAVTRGGPLPGAGAAGPARAPRGSAHPLAAAGDPARTTVPPLRPPGADLRRLQLLPPMVEPELQGFSGDPGADLVACERMPTVSADDLKIIERRAAALGDCRLIVFDPISAYLGGRADHRNADLRRLLAPLKDMAERLGAAVVLVSHHNKTGASRPHREYPGLGSTADLGLCPAPFP